jgi:hypothetical protein
VSSRARLRVVFAVGVGVGEELPVHHIGQSPFELPESTPAIDDAAGGVDHVT